jgi:D-lactate dehydrogenase (cytochrome)
MEYFDEGALEILRRQRETSAAFSALPEVPDGARACVFVELETDDAQQALAETYELGRLLTSVGASEDDTWVARTQVDRDAQTFFRHAVPESVNMLIDERRRTDPTITKLGSDMSVPDERLHDVVAMYRRTLAAAGLESAAWGHIGNNHLHVNVLPRDAADFSAGKALFRDWAREVTAMGGAVSAEHGVGKLKRDFLLAMYGPDHIREMAACKRQLDPAGILGRGNLFDEALLPGTEAATEKTTDTERTTDTDEGARA